MARHSAHLDEKLLQTGLDLITAEGVKSLTVRKVCQRSNVNLGMFSYFFKNKEFYIKKLFEVVHTQIDSFLQMDVVRDLNSMEQLRYLLRRLVKFAYENNFLLRAIIIDFISDEKLYKEFLQKGIILPQKQLFTLIEQAQKSGYITTKMDLEELHEFLFFSIVLPPLCPTLAQLPIGKLELRQHDFDYYLMRCDKILKELEVKRHE